MQNFRKKKYDLKINRLQLLRPLSENRKVDSRSQKLNINYYKNVAI